MTPVQLMKAGVTSSKGIDFARQYYTENNGNQHLDKEFRVLNFIDSFRKRGHLFTKDKSGKNTAALLSHHGS